MTLDDSMQGAWAAMQKRRQSDREAADAADGLPLYGGGGGGTFGGMEARLAKLEAQMEHVQSDLTKLGSLPADVAGMKSNLANLPTKDYLGEKLDRHLRNTGIIFAIIATIFGTVFKLMG